MFFRFVLMTLIAVVSNPLLAQGSPSFGERISPNLRINYFSALTGPGVFNMDDHMIEYDGSDLPDPINLWNQISFNYNLGLKFNFVFNPRFTTQLGSTGSLKKANQHANTSFVVLEDLLVAFQGVAFATKKFTFWTRPSLRVSTSESSQRAKILGQIDILSDYNYAHSATVQFGLFQQIRTWHFETEAAAKDQRYLRILNGPYIYYSFNDVFRFDTYYFHTLDHVGGKEIAHLMRNESFTNFSFGPTINFTKNFNIWFYAQVYDRKPEWETSMIGAWISWNNI